MYKYLLCWRYLRTRYIALASIISVTLGVATMIVVNAVMEGFTTEMQDRIHGILSDVVFESHSLEGFPDPDAHMKRIREVAGKYIAGMTPTVVVPGMMVYDVQGQWRTQQVSMIGVDEATHGQVNDFNRYLQHPENRKQLQFDLREGGYDTQDHQAGPEAKPRERMAYAGRKYRQMKAQIQRDMDARRPPVEQSLATEVAAAPPEIIEHEGQKYRRVDEDPAGGDGAAESSDDSAEPATGAAPSVTTPQNPFGVPNAEAGRFDWIILFK